MSAQLPEGWTLAASAFNWSPELMVADRTSPEIAASISASGVAGVIELEAAQTWRTFPSPTDAETASIRETLDATGTSVSIVGASLDDWLTATARRSEDERYEFLLPQLRGAQRLGAEGIRLPIGQAGPALLERLLPDLHEHGLTLYEELQGQQSPDKPQHAAAVEAIAAIDDPRIRLLVDISMLMPSLPPSYLAKLRAGGVDPALVDALERDWRNPATLAAVQGALRDGTVPPQVHTMFMNLVIRFGRSDARDLRGILPLVSGVHLKFWDLDDRDGRISNPIREISAELAGVGFTGTLCSEWGGHEWIDSLTPEQATRAHLALAREAIAEGASTPVAA
ncbi:restriction endonuclease subunit R [Pseudoclavibacter sp. JSM 162008]|uniref:restriction endonuclease subunit R n=1 Tax=Pseudoclavibacter sp. JSM 162008 TaxID=3229855 RepID=UPI0035239E5A